jgi:hypothetical protein
MRTETNIFTRTETSMLRIDDKIAMFSPLIKVLFTRTEMSMLRIDDNIAMFSPLIKVRTLHVECFAALQPCSLLLNVQVFIVSLCRCCATAGRFAAPGRCLRLARQPQKSFDLAGLVPTVECSKSV